MSERAKDWDHFSDVVRTHIDCYTVPQYGDKGEDILTDVTPQYCADQIKKYASRHGRNSRPGQDRLDLLKIAHYAQVAYEKLSAAE